MIESAAVETLLVYQVSRAATTPNFRRPPHREGTIRVERLLPKIRKALDHDPMNLFYPFLHWRHFLSGVYLFNGNRARIHPTARIERRRGGFLQFGTFWYLWRSRGGLHLMENSRLIVTGKVVVGDGAIIWLHPGAVLELGANTLINPNTKIVVKESVRIGQDCAISWDVLITDADWHFFLAPGGTKKKDTSPVEIGDHVWIGARCTVLKGSRVGSGAVIGAHSVVTGHVPPKSVFRNAYAQQVRTDVEWVKW
jgi:acetyltransferase-like isoleucine patch superfamily enzyme